MVAGVRVPFDGASEMQALSGNDMEMEVEMQMQMQIAGAAAQHNRCKQNHMQVDTIKDQQYLQNSHISGQDINDWNSLPALPERKLGAKQTVSNIYRSSFTILFQQWGCLPRACIPEGLRLTTPYSLGLVVRLAELALLTPDCKDEAHAALFIVSRERFVRMAQSPDMLQSTKMERGMPHKRYTEVEVKECAGGLMIKDIEKVKIQCASTPREPKFMAKRDDRAARAEKRSNRRGGDLTGQATESQAMDVEYEAHVGERTSKAQRQESRELRSQRRKEKKERRREKKLHKQRTNPDWEQRRYEMWVESETPILPNLEQAHDTMLQDQAMDIKGALPIPRQKSFARQTRGLARKQRKHTKEVDMYMAHMFDGISMSQDDLNRLRDGKHRRAVKEPTFPDFNATEASSGLPSERMISSPSLFDTQGSATTALNHQPLSLVSKTPGPLVDGEEQNHQL